MSRAEQIYKKPYRARYSSRQLPEESISRVDIRSLAILCPQQSAILRRLTRIVAREQRFEMIIPFVHEVQPALLYPAVEISRRDLVRIMKDAVGRSKDIYRRFFHGDPRAAQFRGIRSEVAAVEIRYRRVVLHHKRSTSRHEIEQLLFICRHSFLRIVGANS